MRFATRPASPRESAALTAIVVATALTACGGSDSSTPTPTQPSAESCAALVNAVASSSSFPANTAITTAAFVPATAASGSQPALPEHCNVLGTVNAGRVGAQSSPGVTQTYAIKWQMRLPTTWNGRLLHEGGGGLDGAIPSTTGRLSAGYAIVGDDSGHDNTVNNDPK